MSLPIGFTSHPAELLRVGPGFFLGSQPTDAAPGYSGKKIDGTETLAERAHVLAQLQEQLFAESRYGGKKSVLLVLQAMDTAGKGGIVGRVAGAVLMKCWSYRRDSQRPAPERNNRRCHGLTPLKRSIFPRK